MRHLFGTPSGKGGTLRRISDERHFSRKGESWRLVLVSIGFADTGAFYYPVLWTGPAAGPYDPPTRTNLSAE